MRPKTIPKSASTNRAYVNCDGSSLGLSAENVSCYNTYQEAGEQDISIADWKKEWLSRQSARVENSYVSTHARSESYCNCSGFRIQDCRKGNTLPLNNKCYKSLFHNVRWFNFQLQNPTYVEEILYLSWRSTFMVGILYQTIGLLLTVRLLIAGHD